MVDFVLFFSVERSVRERERIVIGHRRLYSKVYRSVEIGRGSFETRCMKSRTGRAKYNDLYFTIYKCAILILFRYPHSGERSDITLHVQIFFGEIYSGTNKYISL